MESNSENDSEDLVLLSCATICDIIKPVLKNSKIPFNIKKEVQAISNALEGELVPMCHSYMNYLILLYTPVQSQSSIRCHQPL